MNFLENYKKLNFYILGIVNPKKDSFKGYYKKYKIIDEKEIENYINKNGVTDIIVSSSSTYNLKIFYFRKFLKLNVRVIFLNDIYNSKNLSYSNEIFEPKIEDIIEKNQIENKEKNKIKKFLKNKTIMIAGGAGSIGSVLIERLIYFGPKKIVIVDKDEFNIFETKQKLDRYKNIEFKLLDASNEYYLDKIYKKYNPDFVFNAAAYKHVGIVEENIEYSVNNNLRIAINICKLGIKYKVSNNLLVSTDKAVKPKNFMGMSKYLCEKIYQIYSLYSDKNKKFVIVRFGNVAGSKGSVLPFFQKLIHKKQPLPVTSRKATRYLMSIREASDLIIKASIFGENSKTYVLDMGEPKNIYNLAFNLIKFNGLSLKNKSNPTGDIEIKIVGLKKGEKLHEKLADHNNLLPTKYNKIYLCNETFSLKKSKHECINTMKNLIIEKNFKKFKNKVDTIF